MEAAINFKIQQQATMGILHRPQAAISVAVLIVVGGPQYRVGSHRQFVQLSRYLATQNIISFRFDVRGMGDASGDKQTFEDINDDIKAATDCLLSECPEISKVVIWGLCDAASAALMYAQNDCRIHGLVLLNPWLRNEQAMAKTMVRFYYLRRLTSKVFWKKLLSGKVNVAGGLKDAGSFVSESVQQKESLQNCYQKRMLNGAVNFAGPVCLILSGNDLTAREFSEQTLSNKEWKKFAKEKCQIFRLPDADHTFSNIGLKREVEMVCTKFVQSLKE